MSATFTDDDLANAAKFANYNFNIGILKLLLKKAPHLTTHLTYTDRKANIKDFYIPQKLENQCRVLDISISKVLCEKLSCNKTTMTGVCKPDTDVHTWVMICNMVIIFG